jgi:hypothetical protein
LTERNIAIQACRPIHKFTMLNAQGGIIQTVPPKLRLPLLLQLLCPARLAFSRVVSYDQAPPCPFRCRWRVAAAGYVPLFQTLPVDVPHLLSISPSLISPPSLVNDGLDAWCRSSVSADSGVLIQVKILAGQFVKSHR